MGRGNRRFGEEVKDTADLNLEGFLAIKIKIKCGAREVAHSIKLLHFTPEVPDFNPQASLKKS